MRLIVNANLVNSFRRRAKRRFPSEYGEMVYGSVEPDGTLVVQKFYRPSAVASVDHWFPQHVPATLDGWSLLGDVHTHPSVWNEDFQPGSQPSDNDWKRAVDEGHLLQGICAVWQTVENGPLHSQLRWYLGQAKLKASKPSKQAAACRAIQRKYEGTPGSRAVKRRYETSELGRVTVERYVKNELFRSYKAAYRRSKWKEKKLVCTTL